MCLSPLCGRFWDRPLKNEQLYFEAFSSQALKKLSLSLLIAALDEDLIEFQ